MPRPAPDAWKEVARAISIRRANWKRTRPNRATYHATAKAGQPPGFRKDEFMPTPAGKESVSFQLRRPLQRDRNSVPVEQQSLLGEFGRTALQTRDIGQILQRATELCAQGLETPFAKVLEYMPEEKGYW
jgi:hypothetical protein